MGLKERFLNNYLEPLSSSRVRSRNLRRSNRLHPKEVAVSHRNR